jgi:hypothetical protein
MVRVYEFLPLTGYGITFPFLYPVQNVDCKLKLNNKHVSEMLAILVCKMIVKCNYLICRWTFMRERTDKSLPNAFTTATAVCNSIKYPITQEMLIDFVKKHPVPPCGVANVANGNNKRPAPMAPPSAESPAKKPA